MKQHLEIEYKTMITEEDFHRLKKRLPFLDAINQRNDYYDTPNHDLFRQHIMCRIRTYNDMYEFTLKKPQADGVLEHEIILDDNNLYHRDITVLLSSYNIAVEDMVLTAYSQTQRYVYSDKYGDWCLDASSFANHNDFELEYELHEANEKAYDHYLRMLESLEIQFVSAKPKYIRALHSSQ